MKTKYEYSKVPLSTSDDVLLEYLKDGWVYVARGNSFHIVGRKVHAKKGSSET